MALPFDVASFNLIEFANIYSDFIDTNNPKTIQVQLKDNNGNIVTKNIDNVGKIKAKFDSWRDSFEFRYTVQTYTYQVDNNWKNTLAKIGKITFDNGFYIARLILIGDFNYPSQRIEFDLIVTKWAGDH